MPAIRPKKYQRKPYGVTGVQVTEENMRDVAKWCGGRIRRDDNNVPYIKVKVRRPADERQTEARPTDWVLLSKSGPKVYLDDAFRRCYDEVVDEGVKVQTTNVKSDASPASIAEEQKKFAEAQPRDYFHVTGFTQ